MTSLSMELVSYGKKETALEVAEKKFPFKMLFDENFRLAGKFGINQVPVKIFVEDGIVKKAWGGATIGEEKRTAFVKWLSDLK